MTALDALKAQLNIIGTDDDALLATKLEAAIAYTTHQIGAAEIITWEDAPSDLRQAILMLAAWWYEQRESGIVGMTASTVPFGYNDIILPHRDWAF